MKGEKEQNEIKKKYPKGNIINSIGNNDNSNDNTSRSNNNYIK